MGTRALEIRVGAVALVLGIVAVVAGLWVARPAGPSDVTVYIDFPKAAGLKVGSKVCIAGVPAGAVVGVKSFDGRMVEAVGRRVYVRAEIELDAQSAGMVQENASYVITTEGVLGERYVEISPSAEDAPAVVAGSIIRGDPSFEQEALPRHGSTISGIVARIAREHGETLGNLGGEVATVLDAAKSAVSRGGALIERHGVGVEQLATRAVETRDRAREVGESLGDALTTTRRADLLGQAEHAAAALGEGMRAITEDTGKTFERLGVLREAADQAGDQLGPRVDRVVDDGAAIVRDVRALAEISSSPDSSLGALIRDRELLDDVLGMTKDVKRHPWKLLLDWDQ